MTAELPKRNTIERNIIQRVDYPRYMSYDLVKPWTHIPETIRQEPTPLRLIDLTSYRLGQIFVKDESDRAINPTGTVKDRFALYLVGRYKQYATHLMEQLNTESLHESELGSIPVPRVSNLTAGNEGQALAYTFERFDLPPPKLLINKHILSSELEKIQNLRADIYQVDFSQQELSIVDILRLTENPSTIEFSDTNLLHSDREQLYIGLAEEVFAEAPDNVYVGYGSGKQFEDLFSAQNTFWGKKQRQVFSQEKLKERDPNSVNIFAADPDSMESVADKLVSPYRPFSLFGSPTRVGKLSETLTKARDLGITGKDTQICKVEERFILRAYAILLQYGLQAEPSAAGGLALYMQRVHEEENRSYKGNPQKILGHPTNNKVVIVSSGNGSI